MPRTGRPRKPVVLHLVDGTHRRDRHGDAQDARQRAVEAQNGRLPSPPSWLSQRAKSEWRRIAKTLHSRGLLTAKDVPALAGYCRAYAEMIEHQLIVEEQGRLITTSTGTVIQHPSIGAANSAAKQMLAFLTEFGLSPASESRVAQRPNAPADDFESWQQSSQKKPDAK